MHVHRKTYLYIHVHTCMTYMTKNTFTNIVHTLLLNIAYFCLSLTLQKLFHVNSLMYHFNSSLVLHPMYIS